jgi:hypothetical protein
VLARPVRLAWLGREQLHPAAVEDQFHVAGEAREQRGLPVRSQPCGLADQPVVQTDQVGDRRLQDRPAQSGAQLLVLCVQAVDDRLAVRCPEIEVGQPRIDVR